MGGVEFAEACNYLMSGEIADDEIAETILNAWGDSTLLWWLGDALISDMVLNLFAELIRAYPIRPKSVAAALHCWGRFLRYADSPEKIRRAMNRTRIDKVGAQMHQDFCRIALTRLIALWKEDLDMDCALKVQSVLAHYLSVD